MSSAETPTGPASPTFLVIGAARSGSTYLTRALDQHPQVSVCTPKEPHFLAFAGTAPAFTGPGDDETINRLAITDEQRWRELFLPDPAVTQYGDGSVTTLYFHERSIPNIARYCPDARMIVMLRDPVERAFSAFQYWTGRGFETETFSRGLDLEAERIAAGHQHIWHYTRMGFYSEQLRPFIDAFGRDRLLVLGYEEFMADKRAGLERCSAFLGIDPFPELDLDLEVNAGGVPRSRLVTGLMRRIRRRPALHAFVIRVVPWQLRERIRSTTVTHLEMSTEERRRLESLFAPERRALLELLGGDAPSWVHR